MASPEKYQPGEEELKHTEERTLHDANLLEKGAKYVKDEGATDARLELTADQIATLELEKRRDFNRELDNKAEMKKKMEVIFATLDSEPSLQYLKRSYNVGKNCKYFTDPEDAKRYSLEDRLRSMSESEIELFLKSVQADQVYVTSHTTSVGIDEGERIRLWLNPPVEKGRPDWGTTPGGGLAESSIHAYKYDYAESTEEKEKLYRIGKWGQELIGKVTRAEGQDAQFDLVEEVTIKDDKKQWRDFGEKGEYKRWLLKRKSRS